MSRMSAGRQTKKQVIPLQSFVQDYKAQLPQVIVVHESLYGVCPGSLKDGQQLEVYCTKETPTVTLKVLRKSYTVPVNSSYKFSYLYNPCNDLQKARRGYGFETAADLMEAHSLPQLVYVGNKCKGQDQTGTTVVINKGQVLILKNIEKERKLLKCVTVNKRVELYLQRNCEGHFDTYETQLLFPLSVLLSMELRSPITTSIYTQHNKLHPRFNNKSGLLYNDVSTSHSIIASLKDTQTTSPNTRPLIEVYTTLPLDVHIAKLINTEIVKLREKSTTLLQNLAPDQVSTVICDPSPIEDILKKDLLLPTHNKDWLHDISCLKSETIYEPLMAEKQDRKKERTESTTTILLPIDSMPIVPPLPVKRGPKKSKELFGKTSDDQKRVCSNDYDVTHKIATERELIPVIHNNAYRTHEFIVKTDDMKTMLPPIYPRKMSEGDKTIKKERSSTLSTLPFNREAMTQSRSECTGIEKRKGEFLDFNKSLLADYDSEKIVQLLVRMGLTQYASEFRKEFITGKLFFDLDEEILREDLGMTKRLHRIRMMKLITGEDCVTNYIT